MTNFTLLQLLVAVLTAFSSGFVYPFPEGLSVNLIHRDSPLSPYYNKSATPHERLVRAAERSFRRSKYLSKKSFDNDFSSSISSTSGEYFVTFSIGTPEHEIIATLDTGSDLTWTQCDPCLKCSEQYNSYFDPQTSTTYQKLGCSTHDECKMYKECTDGRCIKDESFCVNNYCRFIIVYEDGTDTSGETAYETFKLHSITGDKIPFPRIRFGCAHKNDALEHNSHSGIAGFGGGSFSLISQIGYMLGSLQFSYCLKPFRGIARIDYTLLHFGTNADIEGEGVVSTPIVTKIPKTLYFLTLTSIYVGNQKFLFSSQEKGNIFIDSAATVTELPNDDYLKLRAMVVESIDYAEPYDEEVDMYDLCYYEEDNIVFPDITFEFEDASIILPSQNVFIPNVDGKEGEKLLCMSIAPGSSGNLPVFGVFSQMNFIVKYDLEDMKISFKPTEC